MTKALRVMSMLLLSAIATNIQKGCYKICNVIVILNEVKNLNNTEILRYAQDDKVKALWGYILKNCYF